MTDRLNSLKDKYAISSSKTSSSSTLAADSRWSRPVDSDISSTSRRSDASRQVDPSDAQQMAGIHRNPHASQQISAESNVANASESSAYQPQPSSAYDDLADVTVPGCAGSCCTVYSVYGC